MGTLEAKTTEPELPQMEASERVLSVRSFLDRALKGDLPSEERICEEHGPYKAMQTPRGWTSCYECEKRRIDADLREHNARMESEAQQRRAEQLLRRAAIPPRFKDRRLSTFVAESDGAKRALAVAEAYANDFDVAIETGASLILCGGVGTGKTHLAVGIAHQVLQAGKSALFTSVMGATRAVKETYRRDSEQTESDVIDGFIDPHLLILDEVGVQFGSDTEKLILFEIINGRYERLRPTILISNLAKDALAQFIGERVFDRLREGGGKLVVFDWPSYRRQA